MTLRTATTDDCEAIQGVAERSFQASYALSPDDIETILAEEFDEEALSARIEADDSLVVVAEDGGAIRGFVDADLEAGMLRWLHVDPSERGDGVGTALVERVVAELSDRPLTARVLDEATEGASFLERFGLDQSDTQPVEFGEQSLSAHIYTEAAEEADPNEPNVEVPEQVMMDGAERPVDRDDPIPGTDAPFFPTYTGDGEKETYGYFCSNCGSTDVSADGLDRLECGECGNTHQADEWDDAYL